MKNICRKLGTYSWTVAEESLQREESRSNVRLCGDDELYF